MSGDLERLTHPKKVYSRSEVFAQDGSVLKVPGAYSWFFKEIPPDVPTTYCIKHDELLLLYIGISPKRPPRSGQVSSQTLWSRIREHFTGNAYGSTLRLSLGCLLSRQLGIRLRRVGAGGRMTFTREGEETLSRWMEQNAFVAWVRNTKPWEIEALALTTISLPLNLRGNERHPFHLALSAIRAGARRNAIQPRQ